MSDAKTALAKPITPFEPQSLDQALVLADQLSKSNLLPTPLRKRPEDVLVQILTGRELGLSPMQSIRGMHVIEGKAVMSADLMVGLVLSRGEVCEYFRLVESTDQKAVYETKRKGAPAPVAMTFTFEQAKAAGVTGKDNWRKWPSAMLRARCSSALARAVYADLMAGVYDTDEGDEIRASKAKPVNGDTAAAQFAPKTQAPKVQSKPAAAVPPAPKADPKIEDAVIVPPAVEAAPAVVIDPPAEPHDTITGEVIEREPGSDDGAPTPCELLLGALDNEVSHTSGLKGWLERKNAVEAQGQLNADDLAALKAAYTARFKALRAEGK